MRRMPNRDATVLWVVQSSCFAGSSGVRECHLLIRPVRHARVEVQLEWLAHAYEEALAQHGFEGGTAVFRRFFCSDLANQRAALETRPLSNRESPDEPCAISWVEQAPASPAKVALWAYHVSDPAGGLEKRRDFRTLTCTRGALAHLWTTGIVSPDVAAEEQTRANFAEYARCLRRRGLSLAQHALRTWLFIADIDADYERVAAERRAFFAEHGLTPDTHFIASTGIQGRAAEPGTRVMLDAYAVGGVRPEQVRFLSAPDHLSPTHIYGVTFERATQITYRDRAHVLLSGTASIDSAGRVLHAGDVLRQLERTLENLAALLRAAGATLDDLAVVIAYIRDPADRPAVRAALRRRCEAPVEVLIAPICRPAWLVEVEGIAICPAARPDLPAF